jgi:hypothetical protein
MSSTAVNYHSEATEDDPEHPCIEPRYGCTVNAIAYAGVDDNTPSWRTGYVGIPQRGIGAIPFDVYNGPTVLNYDNLATFNTGCQIAIEGCMDSTAANYNPLANHDAYSWCVPRVVGCMMPTETNANTQYLNPSVHQHDGLNANFSIFATVHDPAACIVARRGCMEGAREYPGYATSISAVNYDPAATVPTTCYWPKAGCLNPAAINFGCDSPDMMTPCNLAEKATMHVGAMCRYSWHLSPAPPAPPPPQLPSSLPSDAVVKYEVTTTFLMAGDLDYFTEEILQQTKEIVRVAMGLPAGASMNATVEPASVRLTVTFTTEDSTTANAAAEASQTAFATQSATQSLLGDAIGVQALSAGEVVQTTIIVLPPERTGLNGGEIFGIVVGVLIGIFCLIALVMHMRRAKDIYPEWYVRE